MDAEPLEVDSEEPPPPAEVDSEDAPPPAEEELEDGELSDSESEAGDGLPEPLTEEARRRSSWPSDRPSTPVSASANQWTDQFNGDQRRCTCAAQEA